VCEEKKKENAGHVILMATLFIISLII